MVERRGELSMQCTNPECRRIRHDLEEELKRIKSTSYDMLKQKGDWQTGAKTHDDHSMAYDSFFNHEVEELSAHLQGTSGMAEDEARQILCQLFQRVYNNCRERVLNRMRDTLAQVVGVAAAPSSAREAEDLHDACRAYGLLLHSSRVRETKDYRMASKQVHSEVLRAKESLQAAENELSRFTRKAARLSWNLLCTVPPLVCTQPQQYSRDRHHREMAPLWNRSLHHFELVYYRPVLFLSYEGRVAQRAWVGNREQGTTLCKEEEEEELTVPGIQRRKDSWVELEEPLDPGRGRGSESPQEVEFLSHHYSAGVDAVPSAVGSVLEDLLHRTEETEPREEQEQLKYESLPLLRLTNK